MIWHHGLYVQTPVSVLPWDGPYTIKSLLAILGNCSKISIDCKVEPSGLLVNRWQLGLMTESLSNDNN